MLRIVTSNSTYHIDPVRKTWERVWSNGTQSDKPLRSTSGPYDDMKLSLGQHMLLACPPIREGYDGRLIVTSTVIDIREVPDVRRLLC